jgi:hypothetical protein
MHDDAEVDLSRRHESGRARLLNDTFFAPVDYIGVSIAKLSRLNENGDHLFDKDQ